MDGASRMSGVGLMGEPLDGCGCDAAATPYRAGVMVVTEGGCWPAFAEQLRADGIRLTTRHSLPLGGLVHLRFPVPGAGRVDVTAVVTRQVPGSASSHCLLTELSFVDLSSEQQQALQAWLHRPHPATTEQ